jgi:hypothetical protein
MNFLYRIFGKKTVDEVIVPDQHELALESPKGRTLLNKLKRTWRNDYKRFQMARELVEMGYDPARPVIEKLLKKKRFGPHHTVDLERFVYGDPWAKTLLEQRNYKALVDIFFTDRSKLSHEDNDTLSSKQQSAYAALEQAGIDAIEVILPEFINNPGSRELGLLLIKCDDKRATAAINDAFESERLSYSVQETVAEQRYKEPKRYVRNILSSNLSMSDKRQKISFLVRSLGYRQGKIFYCKCGFPIQFLYDYGNPGPIYELVKRIGISDDWEEFRCPSCNKIFTRLPRI